MGACTEVDPFFGSDLIPPSQQMASRVDTVMPLSTYQITFDSVSGRIVGSTASSTILLGYVGSVIDPLVGRTTMGTIGNFVPDAYVRSDEWKAKRFGVDPTVDSMKLSLAWSSVYAVGDTTQKMKVSIYPINQRLHSGTVYYTCFDPKGIYDPTKPLAEFTTNGVDVADIKLPKWYADQFITAELNEAGPNKPYSSDSIFLDMFKGFYFKAEPVAPGKRGFIGAMDLDASELRIYYHNKNTTTKPDTTTLGYFFYYADENNQAIYYTPDNTSFVIAQHDYSLATDPRGVKLAAINNLSVPAATLFVQGLGGLAVMAQVNMKEINDFKHKVTTELGYKYVGIHRAELRWKVPERSLFYYDDSFSSLVLANWIGLRSALVPLPDYNPWNASGPGNSMGGSLLRSVGYYSQNITSYMQGVFNGTTKNNQLLLIPDFGINKDNLDPQRSVLSGSAGPKELQPELVLTYTLIR